MEERSFWIQTFGCQMNEYDSSMMEGLLLAHNFHRASDSKKADIILINSCSVRKKPEEKVYSALGRFKALKDKNPASLLAVAGCVAQQEGIKLLEKIPYLDLVFGPSQIFRLPQMLERAWEKGERVCEVSKFHDSVPNHPIVSRPNGVKALLTIMEGCNNFCSFCIVPYVRGRERSRNVEDILWEVENLARFGVKEVTLLGQNVNSYKTNGNGFPYLLNKVHEIKGIERIRFTTSHPKFLTRELISLFSLNKKLCEHIHLPVQSGSDRILQGMRRGYTRGDYLEKIRELREISPQISITTDIIVGFPGEEEKDFEDTLRLLEEVRFDDIFSFKYSDRPNTRASSYPEKLSDEIKARRLSRLQRVQQKIRLDKAKSLIGRIMDVLVEAPSKKDPSFMSGRTRGNRIVNFHGEMQLIGEVVSLRIEDLTPHSLLGKRV